MNDRWIAGGLAWRFLALGLCVACGAQAAERPNIVIILADDLGYGSVGCYGADPALVRTPAIDRLAREGRRFLDANTTSSVCSPTRYSLVTGRYCWRTTLKHEVLGTFSPLHIETNRLTVASLLKRHGYATAAVGKWHLGYGSAGDTYRWRTDYTSELSPGPLDIGFDYHFGVPSNHGDLTGVFVENRFVFGLRSGNIPPGVTLPGPGPDHPNYQATYGPEDTERGTVQPLDLDAPRRRNNRVMAETTDRAIAWMERQSAGRPFFLFFTPVAVHNPITPDDDLAGKSAAGLYGDFIHELDRSVGRILEALDRKGVAEQTLVLFTSDNGGVAKPWMTDTLQTAAINAGLKINGDLRGAKHDVWQGGFKVPFIVRWPGRAPAGTSCAEMISLADILATTAAIVGDPLPPAAEAAEDSRDVLPAILGTPAAPVREDMIVHSADGVFAIRRGSWKWIEGVPVEQVKPGARKTRGEQYREQLFNIADDPAETCDVSAEHPAVVGELRALLNRYRNGGYSREMPPVVDPPGPNIAVLPPVEGSVALDEPLTQVPGAPWTVSSGEWTALDGAVWGSQRKKEPRGAGLRVPCAFTNGVVQYEIRFGGAQPSFPSRRVCGTQAEFPHRGVANNHRHREEPAAGCGRIEDGAVVPPSDRTRTEHLVSGPRHV